MYLKAVEKSDSVKALMNLAELSFRGAENIKRNGARVMKNLGDAVMYLQIVKKHADFHIVEGRVLILEADDLARKTKKKDLLEALKKYKEALELGAKDSSFELGQFYYDEHFNQSNSDAKKKYLMEALKLLHQAVDEGCGIAASYLNKSMRMTPGVRCGTKQSMNSRKVLSPWKKEQSERRSSTSSQRSLGVHMDTVIAELVTT